MFEHRGQQPLSRQAFLRRQAGYIGIAALIVGASLGLGTVGYWYFESLSWLDAFLNASMILSGMGPIHHPETTSGKLFAALYAIYSGVVFLVTVGVIAAPMLHRLLHHFHLGLSAERGRRGG